MGTEVKPNKESKPKKNETSNGGEKTKATTNTEGMKNKNKEHADMFNGKKNHG